jgi:23S rRNA (cytosine1962-C5)-methyltransferase
MNSDWPDYELLDFGGGRKLERFGAWTLDRPCPAAAGVKIAHAAAWRAVTARYDGDRAADGAWTPDVGKWPSHEMFVEAPLQAVRAFRMALKPLPSGQVGVFPEQWASWRWLAERCAAGPSMKVLNLFAYTGASTLAAAIGGAEVVHVDAARSVVERARENASLSGLADRPIRWIVEDALKFCRREAKRGNRYDAVILDPPSYGHGPKGEEWQIKRDLLPLLELCGELTERRPKFALVTCHTAGIGPAELAAYLADGLFGHCGQPPRTGELTLETSDSRRLPSGVFARWPG